MVTFETHKNKVSPHGEEWKNAFKKVATPVLNTDVFPHPILLALTSYFKNPKASSCADPTLYNVLRKFDGPTDLVSLKSINQGTVFYFNDRLFKKMEKKRTRSVCIEIASGRKYLINEIAMVRVKED